MSHLFSQGFVSADLLVTSRDFRVAALAKLRESAAEKGAGKVSAHEVLSAFQTFEPAGIDPAAHWIILAILDKRCDGRPLSRVLSFFSRVNLHRTMDDVRRLGYRISLCQARLTTGMP